MSGSKFLHNFDGRGKRGTYFNVIQDRKWRGARERGGGKHLSEEEHMFMEDKFP